MAEYPLRTVLELRQRERDQAREALAAKLDAEGRARRELERLEGETAGFETAIAKAESRLYEPAADGTLDVGRVERRRSELEYCEAQLDEHHRAVERQATAVRHAVEATAGARQELLEATRGLEAIETHHDKWRQQLKLEASRREERLAEEITTSRFVRRQELQ